MFVRCARCRARRTLGQPLEWYVRIPVCRTPGCTLLTRRAGKVQRYLPDKYRLNHERGHGASAVLCYPGRGGCNGYHFPHRRGSKFCDHNPNLTESDLQEREERGSR